MYKGHTAIIDDCPYTGGKCYYNGSGLNAEPDGDILLSALFWEGATVLLFLSLLSSFSDDESLVFPSIRSCNACPLQP